DTAAGPESWLRHFDETRSYGSVFVGSHVQGANAYSQHNTQISRLFRLLRIEVNAPGWCRFSTVPAQGAGVPQNQTRVRWITQMAQHSSLMQGKRGVVLGVANNRPIACRMAKAV